MATFSSIQSVSGLHGTGEHSAPGVDGSVTVGTRATTSRLTNATNVWVSRLVIPADVTVTLNPTTSAFDVSEIPTTYETMTIGGTLTDGTDPVVFPVLTVSGMSGGKPFYSSGVYGCTWDTETWILTDQSAVWTSTEDVATPDLVTTWEPTSPATGTPTVTAGGTLSGFTGSNGTDFEGVALPSAATIEGVYLAATTLPFTVSDTGAAEEVFNITIPAGGSVNLDGQFFAIDEDLTITATGTGMGTLEIVFAIASA